MVRFTRLVLSLAVSYLAGITGGAFIFPGTTWFASLVKPAFMPPDWIFLPLWIALYALMGAALFLVWDRGTHKFYLLKFNDLRVKPAMGLFALQLVLNALWPILFFGMKNPVYGVIEITALWTVAAVTTYRFSKIERHAAWLMLPYVVWLTVSLALNLNIAVLNA